MMERDFDLTLARARIERDEDWQTWIEKIPFIKFPRSWEVRIIPPFCGAMTRFQVRGPKSENTVSVYLDCHQRLGCWDGPYWEVYPYHDDVGRCDIDDTEDLLRMIKHGLRDL